MWWVANYFTFAPDLFPDTIRCFGSWEVKYSGFVHEGLNLCIPFFFLRELAWKRISFNGKALNQKPWQSRLGEIRATNQTIMNPLRFYIHWSRRQRSNSNRPRRAFAVSKDIRTIAIFTLFSVSFLHCGYFKPSTIWCCSITSCSVSWPCIMNVNTTFNGGWIEQWI